VSENVIAMWKCNRVSALVLGRMAMVAVVPMLLLATAAASTMPIKLSNAVYEVTVYLTNGGSHQVLQNTPFTLPENTPVALTVFTTGPGTATGSYSLYAGQGRDSLQASVNLNGNSLMAETSFGLALEASTSYQVAVTVKPGKMPPGTVTTVPVIASATASLSCGPMFSGIFTAEAAFAGALVDIGNSPSISAVCPGNQNQFPKTTLTNFKVNQPVNVFKRVTGVLAQKTKIGTISDYFDVTVDPGFTIDPTFAYASDFELIYSPGAAPASTPEPTSLIMLGTGIIALSTALRRARR
jgi:hypothetical protein